MSARAEVNRAACIELGEARLRSDGVQWVVESRTVHKKTGESYWTHPRYFGRLDQACRRLLDDELKASGAETLEMLLDGLDIVACALVNTVATGRPTRTEGSAAP